ncbi:hypothetical protein OIDMADRAFT_21777 [Oidiodendron maius Zn]|uniref:Xaa-Pro dipeptidyl-peptidase C-terminal domain-containing protein n=1 Tax=Oidiodendron maius (strain Zn) TaxID=913774 RepID=A0A0C3HF18_OIDMZ|nr:hypothetical protein OIDMADRAFT_21777 [Oidiodendron maius Zn]
MALSNPLKDLLEITEDQKNSLIFEKNAHTPDNAKFPVIVTYGPYGKDIPYKDFHAESFSELNPEHKSEYSVWETPDPVYWTKEGYAIIRADERGSGQSPGVLDTFSSTVAECFADVIEWAAVQPWSSGKVGLLGVSYYAANQWTVAARRPKGLAAIVPWEGFSDLYRDSSRHGGIFSNSFLKLWWDRQVITNQYGKPGRAASNWGEDTIEGDLFDHVLRVNRREPAEENEVNKFRDDEFYSSKECKLENIEVPVLSVANWGGFLLHLRGNVEGYAAAGSKLKYRRLITGRHDLPFYYHDEVELQKSFLSAFLKDQDTLGWSVPGKVPPVSVVLRRGDVGFNNPESEATYKRRDESAWPIPRTQYTKYYLHPNGVLATHASSTPGKSSYRALGSLETPHLVQFVTAPFEDDVEFTGHVVAHLNVSVTPETLSAENDIDLFLTLRHLSPDGVEVKYTGTIGDPIPVAKGWLRLSLRKVDYGNIKHRRYLPYRDYFRNGAEHVVADEIYSVNIEIWPTNVIIQKGGRLVLEVSSGDTQGSGIFQHNCETDRGYNKFAGINHVHFGAELDNYVTLPVIP